MYADLEENAKGARSGAAVVGVDALALARGGVIQGVSDPQRCCYNGHQPKCHREPLDEFEVPGERARGWRVCVREGGDVFIHDDTHTHTHL